MTGLTIRRYCDGVEDALAAFPAGHTSAQQAVEGLGVVVVLEVAKLVHDDVFDAMDRGLNEVDVEGDPARGHTQASAITLSIPALREVPVTSFCGISSL